MKKALTVVGAILLAIILVAIFITVAPYILEALAWLWLAAVIVNVSIYIYRSATNTHQENPEKKTYYERRYA